MLERCSPGATPHASPSTSPTSPLTQDAQAGPGSSSRTSSARRADQLDAAGADRHVVFEASANALDDLVDDDDFWSEQAHSLAVFAAPGGACARSACPTSSPPRWRSGTGSYVKPLLRAVTFPQAAFVLALASGSVRLVEVTRAGGCRSPVLSRPTGFPPTRRERGRQSLDRRPLSERPAAGLRGPEGPAASVRAQGRPVPAQRAHRTRAAADPRRDRAAGRRSTARSTAYPLSRRAGHAPAVPTTRPTQRSQTPRGTVLDAVYARELAAVRERLRAAFRAGPRVGRRGHRWRVRRPTARSTPCWSTSTTSCTGEGR